jgi:hypothetical protein
VPNVGVIAYQLGSTRTLGDLQVRLHACICRKLVHMLHRELRSLDTSTHPPESLARKQHCCSSEHTVHRAQSMLDAKFHGAAWATGIIRDVQADCEAQHPECGSRNEDNSMHHAPAVMKAAPTNKRFPTCTASHLYLCTQLTPRMAC